MALKTRISPHLISLLFALAGFLYVLAATNRHHIGLSVDSAVYLEISENILAGRGVTLESAGGTYELVTHYPPAYPLAVAGFSQLTSWPPLDAARYLSAILLALSFLVFNLILSRYAISTGLRWLLNGLVLLSFATEIYLMAWSEPLFNLLLLLVFYFFIRHLEAGRTPWLLAAAVFSGLLFLTRYAAVGFLGAFGLYLLFRKEKTWPSKLWRVGGYGGVTAIFAGAWILYAASHAGNPTNRNLAFHLPSATHARDFVSTLAHWISPTLVRFSLPFLLVLFAGLLTWAFRKKKLTRTLPALNEKSRLALLLVGMYLAFLLCSVTLFDFHTELQNRILSPIFPFLVLGLIPILRWIERQPGRRWAFYAPLMLILISNGIFFIERSAQFYRKGIGYTGEWWKQSETITYLRELPADLVIVTNGREAIKSLTDRREAVYELPSRLSPNDQTPNPGFEEEFTGLKDAMHEGRRVIIYFDKITHRYYLPEKDYLKKEMDGRRFVELPDGLIIF